ncbi:MAG: glucosamine--fructose-6-phosphate aminotransferase (isomerizing) [Candidatus Deianiraeaceae bacterium]|jgi:glucosamine--fructose-6-phosphate aminotransferase (isomerizing)
MCGIVGYSTVDINIIPLIITSLHHLEYRGYDSVGISFVNDNKIQTRKIAGRIAELERQFSDIPISQMAIAHTRWATHGKPTKENAHPHCIGKVALVHNGIIENYRSIKVDLIKKGCVFTSTTDTETIAHFINIAIQHCSPEVAIQSILQKFKGKYAVSFIIEGDDTIYAFRSSGSPISVGILKDGYMLASDLNTIAHHTNRFITIPDQHFLKMRNNSINTFNADGKEVTLSIVEKDIATSVFTKGDYDTFMMKEIHEQPQVIKNILSHYTVSNKVHLNIPSIANFERVAIVACGTSYYAGNFAKYLIEHYANVPVSVEISSEFCNRKQCFLPKTLYIFASQSGETADTISAMEYAIANKTECSKTLGILNNVQSSIAHKSDFVLECFTGAEIGVASTKNFIAQVTIFYLIAVQNLNDESVIQELTSIPQEIEKLLASDHSAIKKTADKVIDAKKVVFTGRTFLFPIACEGALKLSELSYISVQAIASGEFKHGPIAIVDDTTLVISLTHSQNMYEKTVHSNEEILSRSGVVVMIADTGDAEIQIAASNSYHHTHPLFFTIVVQLLSYYTAEKLGNDIDKPRNLAKSVTVE